MTPDSEAGSVSPRTEAGRNALAYWSGRGLHSQAVARDILAIEAEAAAPSQPVPSGLTDKERYAIDTIITDDGSGYLDDRPLIAAKAARRLSSQPVPSGLLDRLPPATCYRQHTYESDKHLGVSGAVWKADVLRALAATAAPAAEEKG